jgi:hypothetical protein
MPINELGEEIPYDDVPLDEQGNKTNPLGRDIDNFLRNLLGGEGVGGQPTPNLGVLPQAPTQQIGMNRVPQPPTGAPIFPQTLDSGVRGGAGDYDDFGGLELFGPGGGLEQTAEIDPARGDPGGTVGQQVPPVAIPDNPFPGAPQQPATPAAPPAPASPGLNDLLIGPGDALSGVMGLRPEGERLQTPGEMSLWKQILFALGLTGAPLAATGVANLAPLAAGVGQGVRGAGQAAVRGAQATGRGARTAAKKVGETRAKVNPRAAARRASRAADRTAKSNIQAGQSKRLAGELARREARKKAAANTDLGPGA